MMGMLEVYVVGASDDAEENRELLDVFEEIADDD